MWVDCTSGSGDAFNAVYYGVHVVEWPVMAMYMLDDESFSHV